MNSKRARFTLVASTAIGLILALPSIGQSADPVPLTGAALRSACKRQILEKPQLLAAFMIHPGKENQAVGAEFALGQVEGCGPRFFRAPSGRFEMQDYQHPRRWLKLNPWDLFGGGNQESTPSLTVNNSYHKPKLYYKPGSGAKLRFKLRIQDRDTQTGKAIGTRIFTYPVKVRG